MTTAVNATIFTATVNFNTDIDMTSLVHGFTVMENCCSHAECDDIAARLKTVTGAGTRCLLDIDWCQTLAMTLRERLAVTIPDIRDLAAVQCTFFNKSAMNNWFVSHHQDRSIPVASSESIKGLPGWSRKEGQTYVHGPDDLLANMIAIRFHVDDSTSDNGPLRVISDSHGAGTLMPEQIDNLRLTSQDTELTVRKGGVIAMRPLLLHASSRSRITANRRVLHFLFGPNELPDGLKWRRCV
ncbi:phytanoyl-CoA dioxygenase family protein [Pirellula sp. SH-Sr6A]|uniref:phytanoyl-CoA dioxygenase family protein n=1 Tax=Pirellula sp. SH-Sr6A TaxID=1632865 RepID=UPI00197C0FE4|nr:phytanoyl-CoA dioxygenase family protein [Pirellula sp. SH-Sr6A]